MNEFQRANRKAKIILLTLVGAIVAFFLAYIFFTHLYINFQTYIPKSIPNKGAITQVWFSRVANETDTFLTAKTNVGIVFTEGRVSSPNTLRCDSLVANVTCKELVTPKGTHYFASQAIDSQGKPFDESYSWIIDGTQLSLGVDDTWIKTYGDHDWGRFIDSFTTKNYLGTWISIDQAG